MKKFTLLFLILLASTAFSQVNISIPGGTHSGYQTTPINTGWGYSRSAAIYLPGEINQGGQIIRVGWQSLTTITDSIPVKIYMINTFQNNWNTNWSWSDVMSMVGLQTVFNGIIGPTFQMNFDVVLQTPFLHDSTKSLYVIVETNYGGTGSSTTPPEFSVSNPTAGHQRHLIWTANNTPPTGNGGFYNPIPLVRLSFLKETGTAVSSQNVYTRCGYDSLKWTNNTNNDSVIIVVAHTGKKPYLVNGVKYQPGTLIDYVFMPGPSITGDTVIFRGKASSCTYTANDLMDKTYYFWHFNNNSYYSASKNKDGFGALHELPSYDFNQSTEVPFGWGNLFFDVLAGHGSTGNAISVLLKSSTTMGFLNSPYFCGADANTFLRFKYRYVNQTDYPSTATPLANIGTLKVSIVNNGTTINDVYLISDTNHVLSTNYATITIPIGSYANGKTLNIQFTANRGSGTYYLDIDDIEVYTVTGSEEVYNADFNIYPNPAGDMINLSFNDLQPGNSTISIINISGQVLKSIEYNNSGLLNIDISDLSKGIYFINVQTNGKNLHSKFIKI